MGLSRWNQLISAIVLIVAIIYGWKYLFEERRAPCYTVDVKYFGPNIPPTTDATETSTIKSFQIPFEQSQIDDLKDRLTRTRFYQTQMIIDNKFVNRSTYGFNHQTAQSIRDYFLNKFDWKQTVDELNKLSHYKTNIAGLHIHFVRITRDASDNERKQAILFLHGWPGSFLEYLDVARLLNSSSSTTYDIIIPSLPGYGYSDASVRSGMNPIQIARMMHNLMQRLQYTSYLVCGGDWGSIIGTFMAQLYPAHVQGLLITLVMPKLTALSAMHMGLAQLISPSLLLYQDELEFLNHRYDALNQLKFIWFEGGYFHLQSTKPDTIGYALNDSPLGLASYILEKWSRWSNTQDAVDQSINAGLNLFTLDQLLSNVMLYWTTGTITSSMRIYFEYFNAFLSADYAKIFYGPLSEQVPVAIVNYRHELLYVPRAIAQKKYSNIKLWLYHQNGGHFASIETPQEYAKDVETFLSKLQQS